VQVTEKKLDAQDNPNEVNSFTEAKRLIEKLQYLVKGGSIMDPEGLDKDTAIEMRDLASLANEISKSLAIDNDDTYLERVNVAISNAPETITDIVKVCIAEAKVVIKK
jgi:hypothetical protein